MIKLRKIIELVFGYKMKELTLYREYFDDRTEGILTDDNGFKLATLELPWKDNLSRVSCIPEGKYKCVPYMSPKHEECFLLENVPERSWIEIHIANWISQILGCIAIGIVIGDSDKGRMAKSSATAMKRLKEFVGKDADGKLKPFWLEIKASNKTRG